MFTIATTGQKLTAVLLILSASAFPQVVDSTTVKAIHPTNGNGNGNAAGQAGGASGKNQLLQYHKGPVMVGTSNIHFIYYGNFNPTQTSLLNHFAASLSGSPYFNTVTQYYEGLPTSPQYTGNSLSVAASTTLATTSHGTKLSDSNIESIVADAIKLAGYTDPNGIYLVLTDPTVQETSGFCKSYCGWHTNGTIGGVDVKYGFVGNPANCLSACAEQTTSPNGDAGVDAMISVIAHELSETVTDPDLSAWYDNRGEEIGDKCAWLFGTTSKAPNGSRYNVTLGGTEFLIQQLWSNATSACVMSYK